RHHQGQRQVGELLQEARMAPQPGRNLVGALLVGGLVDGIAHRNHSPSNTNAAGPAMTSSPAGSGQRIESSPPGSAIATSRSTTPRRISTAAAAQAPLPQARVSPEPRSYTRSRMRSRAATSAKPTLADCGNAG